MSFWLSYVGIGFAGRAIPYFDDSRTLLFSAPVVVATLLLPASALTGFVWTRRWRYGPFFLGLALVGLLVMGAGFPEGTPLRHGLNFTYNHVAAVRFLRASYKAAPLLAVALACLAGAAPERPGWRLGPTRASGAWLAERARARRRLAVLVLAAPGRWSRARAGRAGFLQARSPRLAPGGRPSSTASSRQTRGRWCCPAICSPSTPGAAPSTRSCRRSAAARWPSAPRFRIPICARPICCGRSTALVHQQRLLPGPAHAAAVADRRALGGQRHRRRSRPQRCAGARRRRRRSWPPAGLRARRPHLRAGSRLAPTALGPPVRLPQVRRYDLPLARGLVRIEPARRAGGGRRLGRTRWRVWPPSASCRSDRPLLYSGDLTAAGLRAALAEAVSW